MTQQKKYVLNERQYNQYLDSLKPKKKFNLPRPKGSSVVISAMYILWIWYICMQVYTYAQYHAWLPMEVTYGTAACFIVETIALARLKMAKEGIVIPKRKVANQFLQKIGLSNESELDAVVDELNEINEKINKEETQNAENQ